MRILICNDDGVQSEFMLRLAEKLALCRHDVSIAAPRCEQSGTAKSMTLEQPLTVKSSRHRVQSAEIPIFAISGTPVDCVRLALGNLVDWPDLLISGINRGPNIGVGVMYSGTCGAAHEASLYGIQSMAVSLNVFSTKYLDDAVEVTLEIIEQIKCGSMQSGTFLNVNIPNAPRSQIKGVKMTRLFMKQLPCTYIKWVAPHAKSYYWLDIKQMIEQNNNVKQETDAYWLLENYITCTPLCFAAIDETVFERQFTIKDTPKTD